MTKDKERYQIVNKMYQRNVLLNSLYLYGRTSKRISSRGYTEEQSHIIEYSWLPKTQTFKGNQKRFKLLGVWVIRGGDSCWHNLSQDTFCVSKHQKTKENDIKDNYTLQNAVQFFENWLKINSVLWSIFHLITFWQMRFELSRVKLIIKKMTWRE